MQLVAIVTLAVATTVLHTSLCIATSQTCPRACRCVERSSTVYCNDKKLGTVPYGISRTTRILHIQDNDVTNGPITDENLSQLTRLRKLNMHDNSLTSVPANLPTTLEYISLRDNHIKFVGKNSLKGLSSLIELHLDGNNITNQGLSSLAFYDCIRLEILELTNNLLESVPESLPSSLQVLQLHNNRISRISRTSLANLNNLKILDLSENVIMQHTIEARAFASLTSLDFLVMGGNQLTEIPRDLPASLTQLRLPRNKIEYIYSSSDIMGDDASDDVTHGSLSHLNQLTSLDLSMNLIKSVEENAFLNLQQLRSVSIHDNQWQCDCHLRYFKQWLSATSAVLSNEQNMRCSSPAAFSDVTLNSIDIEVLDCDARTSTKNMFQIVNVTSDKFRMVWSQSNADPDPPFIERYLLYGPMRCQNCSLGDITKSDDHVEVTSVVHKYNLVDFSSDARSHRNNVSVVVDRLQHSTHYIVCVQDSNQNAVSLNQCVDIWTKALQVTSDPEEVRTPEQFPQLWIILLCCLAATIVFVILIAVAIWRRKVSMHKKNGKSSNYYSSRHNRNDFYYPDSYIPGFTRPPQHPPIPGYVTNVDSYATNASDRTYMECGEADATSEFNVTLVTKNDPNTTKPKLLRTSHHNDVSSCSEYRSDTTMSTNQTATMGSRDNISDVYYHRSSTDSLGQRSQQTMMSQHTTNTTQLRRDTGIFV